MTRWPAAATRERCAAGVPCACEAPSPPSLACLRRSPALEAEVVTPLIAAASEGAGLLLYRPLVSEGTDAGTAAPPPPPYDAYVVDWDASAAPGSAPSLIDARGTSPPTPMLPLRTVPALLDTLRCLPSSDVSSTLPPAMAPKSGPPEGTAENEKNEEEDTEPDAECCCCCCCCAAPAPEP